MIAIPAPIFNLLAINNVEVSPNCVCEKFSVPVVSFNTLPRTPNVVSPNG